MLTVRMLRQNPRQRDLRGRCAQLARNSVEFVDELEVLGEVLGLEARIEAADVVFRKVVDGLVSVANSSQYRRMNPVC